MERLDFTGEMKYNAEEAAIHLERYLLAKPYVNGKRVLDAACGEGYGSRLMMDWGAAEVTGVDISEDGIAKAKAIFEEKNLRFLVHAVDKLPFPNNSFDTVISLETIEHLDQPEDFLREITRVLKPGGTVVLSCPNDAYYARMDENYNNPYHKKRYSFREFQDMTMSFLGTNVKWGLCYALNGFVILGKDDTEPDGLQTASMLPIMQSRHFNDAYILPQMESLVAENSNFYVGIWNAQKEFDSSLTCYPQAYFAVPEKIPYQYAALAQQSNRELRRMQTELAEIGDVRSELQKAQTELAEIGDVRSELHQMQKAFDEIRKIRCEQDKRNEELQAENQSLVLENEALQRNVGIQVEKRECMGELLRKELLYFMETNGSARAELTSLHTRFEQQHNELESTQAYVRTVQAEWKRVQAELESTQAYVRTVQAEWKRVQTELESTQAYTRGVEDERNQNALRAQAAEKDLQDILASRSYKLGEPLRALKRYFVHVFTKER